MRLFLLAAIAATSVALPAFADETSGTIVAYDRLANVVVLDDKSFWKIADETLVPSDLKAGDQIKLTFQSDGDNGAKPATKLERK